MRSRTDMRAYQDRAVEFILKRKRCGLFVDMGLGKTVSTLTAVLDLINACAIKKVLVVAPLRVARSVWTDEVSEWSHLAGLRVSVCLGNEKQRLASLAREADIYTINRENVGWLVKKANGRWDYDMIVIDESSSFKSPSSQRFRALKKVHALSPYMVLLTGSPAPNGLLDVWSQYFLIDSGASLGKTYTGYRARFFERDYSGFNWTLKPGATRLIHKAMSYRILSMRAEDYLELPDRIDITVPVELPAHTAKDYLNFEKNLLIDIGGDTIEALSAGVLANKLLQWCNGFVYTEEGWTETHNAKLDAMEDILEDAGDEPVMVAYNYKVDLERIKARFPHATVMDKNPDTIRRWNDRKIKLMLVHPACLHPSTEVLTEKRGWVKIVDVEPDERVFDGCEFVSHGGCSFSGIKPVINLAGITLTPNHKILVGKVWVEAGDVRDIESFRNAASYTYSGSEGYLSSMLPLRSRVNSALAECRQSEQDEEGILSALHRGVVPSNDPHEDMAYLARHEKPCNESYGSRLSSIRWQWSRFVSKLAKFRGLLQRYGRGLQGRSHFGSNRQFQRLFQRKLSVGDQPATAVEQGYNKVCCVSGCDHTFVGVLQGCRRIQMCNDRETESRDDGRRSGGGLAEIHISEKPCAEMSEVYDLVNCGPRNRFLIRNDAGDVFISHNSAGHGLNLQKGSNVLIWFGLNWSLELYEQTCARLHRQGQTRPVRIYHLVAKDCLDERVMDVLAQKDKVQSSLFSALQYTRVKTLQEKS